MMNNNGFQNVSSDMYSGYYWSSHFFDGWGSGWAIHMRDGFVLNDTSTAYAYVLLIHTGQ